MKLVSFRDQSNTTRLGAVTQDTKQIVDLQAGHTAKNASTSPFLNSMLEFLKGGKQAHDLAQNTLDFITTQNPPDTIHATTDIELLSPLPVPESIRDCMAFEQHIINCTRKVGLGKKAFIDEMIERTFGRKNSIAYKANKAWYDRPVYYKSNRFSVVGHSADVQIPKYADKLDYELEWGIVIGQMGTDISKKNAREYIAGYTLFNDFSARDIQLKEMKGRLGPAKGKDFNTGNAIGPCLVTPDEIPDPYNLILTAEINGAEVSRGSTSDMYWSFEDIIEYISQSETLHPGEFIGSGTCSGPQGKGCGLEHGRYLYPGDTITLKATAIGELQNKIIA